MKDCYKSTSLPEPLEFKIWVETEKDYNLAKKWIKQNYTIVEEFSWEDSFDSVLVIGTVDKRARWLFLCVTHKEGEYCIDECSTDNRDIEIIDVKLEIRKEKLKSIK